jgi:hypothetical protein
VSDRPARLLRTIRSRCRQARAADAASRRGARLASSARNCKRERPPLPSPGARRSSPWNWRNPRRSAAPAARGRARADGGADPLAFRRRQSTAPRWSAASTGCRHDPGPGARQGGERGTPPPRAPRRAARQGPGGGAWRRSSRSTASSLRRGALAAIRSIRAWWPSTC